MNKRIKELANEASDWCEQHAEGTPTAWEWEEKFADLIVKECIKVALENDDPLTALDIEQRFVKS